ncbi:hypothetical protein NP233_g8510 [Leucocoprinus birnbaumii]|uniref:Uncharacterized protein n=1 Tax=Leucocoprinus birnbaumii TaxID=56174 RepID=A0AAD5VMS7_9AGAR|nr:hypothetical protein NP233_g8510 [Leucocoprinus birnbaumii]
MGPALAGAQASRRSASRAADFTPSVPTSATAGSALGENLTRTAAPTLLKGKGKAKVKVEEEEGEVYSDPDEAGVEIIDMNKIRDMDWMAPETLKEEKKREKVKKERESEAVDLKNALDLSESEDEEEMEDLIEDFAIKNDLEDMDSTLREDRLYFFQFPNHFPKFTKQATDPSTLDSAEPGQISAEASTKKVSFAPDTKPATTPSSSRPSTAPPEPVKEELVDGVIGQLEVYRSGAVKIRLTNGTLLDVNAATQPSFLQQAVYLDTNNKQLVVLGEVNKQFVVSPDIDSLLETMNQKEEAEAMAKFAAEIQDQAMDTT